MLSSTMRKAIHAVPIESIEVARYPKATVPHFFIADSAKQIQPSAGTVIGNHYVLPFHQAGRANELLRLNITDLQQSTALYQEE